MRNKTRIALGSIDNAALNSAGGSVAWALRKSNTVDDVQINVARITVAGVVSTQNALREASQ